MWLRLSITSTNAPSAGHKRTLDFHEGKFAFSMMPMEIPPREYPVLIPEKGWKTYNPAIVSCSCLAPPSYSNRLDSFVHWNPAWHSTCAQTQADNTARPKRSSTLFRQTSTLLFVFRSGFRPHFCLNASLDQCTRFIDVISWICARCGKMWCTNCDMKSYMQEEQVKAIQIKSLNHTDVKSVRKQRYIRLWGYYTSSPLRLTIWCPLWWKTQRKLPRLCIFQVLENGAGIRQPQFLD